jgi:hypothetical protein
VDVSEIFSDVSGEIAQGLVVDAFNRQAVIDLFNAVYVPALSVPSAWNGSIATCTAGSPALLMRTRPCRW